MQIIVNGQPRTLETTLTLADLLVDLALPPRRVAIELNRHIVRRDQYDHTTLHDGDTLEIVTLVGGG